MKKRSNAPNDSLTHDTQNPRYDLRWEFLLKLSDSLRSLSDPAAIEYKVAQTLGEYLNLARCFYFHTEKEDSGWVHVVKSDFHHKPGMVSLIGRHPQQRYGASLLKGLDRGETLVINDVSSIPGLAAEEVNAYKTLDAIAFVAAPLIKNGVYVAALCAMHDRPREWTSAEIDLVTDVAERTWEAVERAITENALRDREAWLKGQQRAFQAAMGGASLKTTLELLIDVIIKQTDGKARAAFYRTCNNDSELYLLAGMDDTYAADVNGFKVGPDSLACGLSAHSDKPVLTPDVEEEPLWQPFVPMARKHNYRACWSFPVRTEGGPMLGTLAMYFAEPRAAAAGDIEMATVLALAAAIIISRDEQLNERTRAEAALHVSELQFRNKLQQEVAERTADLKKGEELLQATLDSNLEMIQVFKAVRNDAGKIIDFEWILNNHASELIYGDVIGKSLLENNPGVVKQGIFDKFVETVETGIPQQYERHYAYEQFDGWFHQSVVKLDDGVATNTVNITERKRAGLQLQASRDRLQSIIDTTLVQMSILEAIRNKKGKIIDFRIMMVNNELEKETGRTDLPGKLYVKEYPGIKPTGLFDLIVKTIETGEPQSTEYFYPHGGFNKWYSCVFVKLGDGVVATNMNITPQKQAEEKLRRMEAEQQREIFRVSLDTLEEERRRISESLHNGLGQLLYGIKINLTHLTDEQAKTDPETFRANRKYTDDLLTKAIRESRRISHELMPAMLEDFGLVAAVEDICKQFSDGVQFRCFFKGLNKRLDKYFELAVFRIVQELMTNIIKHAKASQASTEVIKEGNQVLVEVKDNGIGFNTADIERPGIGLASIRSKARLLNGQVSISSKPGKGTVVKVEIPLGALAGESD